MTLATRRIVLGAAMVATLLCFAAARPALERWVTYTRMALAYTAPLDAQEGFALWETDRWRDGLGLYVPTQRDSFVSAPYPPIHPWLMLQIGAAHGAHPFWGGRMLALVALLLTVAGAVALIRVVTGSWLGGLAAGGVILAQPPFQLWAMRIKPDMLGLCFTVWGLALVAGLGKQRWAGRRAWLQAGLLAAPFVLAHFTKQTLVAGPMAVMVWLWVHEGGFAWLRRIAGTRRSAGWWAHLRSYQPPTTAFYFLGAFAGMLAVVWIALDLWSGGQYTYHVWVLHKLGWRVSLWQKLVALLAPLWPAMLLGVLGLAATWRRPTAVNAYALLAPVSLISAGVQGAHHNHLLETGLALALVAGQAVGVGLRGLALHPRHGWLVAAALPLLALQWALLATPLPWFANDYAPDPDRSRFVDFIRATPGEILADDVGLLYAAGRPLRYDDPSAMGPAVAQGLWREDGLLDDIRNRRFSAILFHMEITPEFLDTSGHWSPNALRAIYENYDIKFADTVLIYVPKME